MKLCSTPFYRLVAWVPGLLILFSLFLSLVSSSFKHTKQQEPYSEAQFLILRTSMFLPPGRGGPLTSVHSVCMCTRTLVLVLSCVRLFVTPRTVAHQAPLGMGFSRQEYWSGLPFASPGDLPDPGIKPRSSVFAGRFFSI